MTDTTTETRTEPGPMDGLKDAVRGLGKTALGYGVSRASSAAGNLTERLTDFSSGPVGDAVAKGAEAKAEGDGPLKATLKGVGTAVKDTVTGGGSKNAGGKQKYTNIVEWIDVGVPVRVAYNQWTEFEQWSSFMKKIEYVKRSENDGKLDFKGQVWWSHRTWQSNLVEMVPDDHIVWRSQGQKGYLNGAVGFSEYGPHLTRITVVVEYHPQGLIEKTINIWRAVGRAVRREIKRYVHQVMTVTILDPDSVEGWRAEIRDSEIVRTHDEVVEQEQQEEEERRQAEQDAEDSEDSDDDEGVGDDAAEDDEDREDAYDDEDSADDEGTGDERADDEDSAADDEDYDDDADDEDYDDEDEDEDRDDEYSDEDDREDEYSDEDEDEDEDSDDDREDAYDEDSDSDDAEDEDSRDQDREPVASGGGRPRGGSTGRRG